MRSRHRASLALNVTPTPSLSRCPAPAALGPEPCARLAPPGRTQGQPGRDRRAADGGKGGPVTKQSP